MSYWIVSKYNMLMPPKKKTLNKRPFEMKSMWCELISVFGYISKSCASCVIGWVWDFDFDHVYIGLINRPRRQKKRTKIKKEMPIVV